MKKRKVDKIEYMFLPLCSGIDRDVYRTVPVKHATCRNPITKPYPTSWLGGFCHECIIALITYWMRNGYTKLNPYINEACTWLEAQGLRYDRG